MVTTARPELTAADGDVLITPGFLDLQINGFAGIDFNSPGLTAETLDHALEAMLRTGVTACLPTLITAPVDELEERFRALVAATGDSRYAEQMVVGFHLEGPFLSSLESYRGCHPAECMCPAEVADFDRLQAAADGRIRLVTVAPEVTGALALIEHLCGQGVVAALGHTAADGPTIAAAAAHGARLSTHLGNGAPAMLHRFDNVITHQLCDDRLMASFIADGYHLAPAILRSYLRAKSLSRSILVTDAVAGAAAPPGDYRLGRVAVRRGAEPVITLPGTQLLAGSALTLDWAARNLLAWTEFGFDEIFTMARTNPARLLGQPDPAPSPGRPADLVRWVMTDSGPEVESTRLGGTVIASRS
jgi:N-acetylglucosamine-6-phosphate deacetylase